MNTQTIQPINQAAAVQAVLRAAQYHPSAPYCNQWIDFAETIKANPAARELLADVVQFTTADEPKDDETLRALGVGMAAGLLYASIAGTTLGLVPPRIDTRATPEAPEVA